MTELAKYSGIDSLRLNRRQYFTSLLAEGQRLGLVSERDGARLQGESLTLLAERVQVWSRGESSSLPVEAAQELLASVLYAVSAALLTRAAPEQALADVLTLPLAQLYQEGQRCIQKRVQTARSLHRQLKRRLFDTPNVFYRATIIDGVEEFFKLYHPETAAQETHITADYPPFFGLPEAEGILFIEAYLHQVSHEDRFCRYFAPETVHKLLLGLDSGYAKTVMNLYAPVLTAALCCVLTDRPAAELHYDSVQLAARLEDKTETEVTAMLADAAETLMRQLDCPGGLTAYIRRSVPPLAAALHRAAAQGHPETAAPLPVMAEAAPFHVSFSYGTALCSQEYAAVLAQVIRSRDRAACIAQQQLTPGDLTALLHDAPLTVGEITALLGLLPGGTVAVLFAHYRRYPTDSGTVEAALDAYAAALPEMARRQLRQAAAVLEPEP